MRKLSVSKKIQRQEIKATASGPVAGANDAPPTIFFSTQEWQKHKMMMSLLSNFTPWDERYNLPTWIGDSYGKLVGYIFQIIPVPRMLWIRNFLQSFQECIVASGNVCSNHDGYGVRLLLQSASELWKGSAKNSTKKIGAELLLMEELRPSPVEVGSLSRFFSSVIHPRWF